MRYIRKYLQEQEMKTAHDDMVSNWMEDQDFVEKYNAIKLDETNSEPENI